MKHPEIKKKGDLLNTSKYIWVKGAHGWQIGLFHIAVKDFATNHRTFKKGDIDFRDVNGNSIDGVTDWEVIPVPEDKPKPAAKAKTAVAPVKVAGTEPIKS